MSEYAELKAAFLAAIDAHEDHPPRLRQGRDGVWRCPACEPPGTWERIVVLARLARAPWKFGGAA